MSKLVMINKTSSIFRDRVTGAFDLELRVIWGDREKETLVVRSYNSYIAVNGYDIFKHPNKIRFVCGMTCFSEIHRNSRMVRHHEKATGEAIVIKTKSPIYNG